MGKRSSAAVFVIIAIGSTSAFSPLPSSLQQKQSICHQSPLFTRQEIQNARYSKTTTTTTSLAASSILSNPFKSLPWIVKKEREREARRLKVESAKLHRELGIAEDATFEEITEATNLLIERAGSDVKKKIKVEVAKDRIMQIRLNERLAGLVGPTDDARLAEDSDLDDEMDALGASKAEAEEPQSKNFFQENFAKPSTKYRNNMIRVFGSLSLASFLLRPLAPTFGFISFFVCISVLANRDVPDMDRYEAMMARNRLPMGMATFVAIVLWLSVRIMVGVTLPANMDNSPYADAVENTICNIILGTACAYIKLKPPKGSDGFQGSSTSDD